MSTAMRVGVCGTDMLHKESVPRQVAEFVPRGMGHRHLYVLPGTSGTAVGIAVGA